MSQVLVFVAEEWVLYRTLGQHVTELIIYQRENYPKKESMLFKTENKLLCPSLNFWSTSRISKC